MASEVIGLEPKEEEAVEMVVRAREVGRRTLPINLDDGEDDENDACYGPAGGQQQGQGSPPLQAPPGSSGLRFEATV